jgi:putative MATE family efflux protein
MQPSKSNRQEARRTMMLQDPIHKLIPKMAVPTIISMLIMSFYNMADTYFVSSLGIEATGAVGVNASLQSFIQMAGSFLAIGANSYIARLLGAKRDEQATRVLSTAFFTAILTGSLMMVFGLIFMDPLVAFLGAKDPLVIRYAKDYAGFMLYAAPFMTSAFVMNQCLRAEGSATFSMWGMVSGAILNLALDPLFIFVFGWGVAGAAFATAISKVVSFLILLSPYLRKHTLLHISWKKFGFTKDIAMEISKMGAPTFLRSGLMTLAQIITNNLASGFSAAALAAISVVNRIMMFITSAILGFGQGYQPVAGFNWGAKRYDRVLQAFRFASIAGVTGVSILALFAGIFAPQIMGVFTTNPETIRIGAFSLRLQCIVMPIHAWVIVVNMTYAGLGKALGAALLGLSRQGIFFIPSVAILSMTYGVMGLAAAQATADLLSLILGLPLAIIVLRQVRELAKEAKQL